MAVAVVVVVVMAVVVVCVDHAVTTQIRMKCPSLMVSPGKTGLPL